MGKDGLAAGSRSSDNNKVDSPSNNVNSTSNTSPAPSNNVNSTSNTSSDNNKVKSDTNNVVSDSNSNNNIHKNETTNNDQNVKDNSGAIGSRGLSSDDKVNSTDNKVSSDNNNVNYYSSNDDSDSNDESFFNYTPESNNHIYKNEPTSNNQNVKNNGTAIGSRDLGSKDNNKVNSPSTNDERVVTPEPTINKPETVHENKNDNVYIGNQKSNSRDNVAVGNRTVEVKTPIISSEYRTSKTDLPELEDYTKVDFSKAPYSTKSIIMGDMYRGKTLTEEEAIREIPKEDYDDRFTYTITFINPNVTIWQMDWKDSIPENERIMYDKETVVIPINFSHDARDLDTNKAKDPKNRARIERENELNRIKLEAVSKVIDRKDVNAKIYGTTSASGSSNYNKKLAADRTIFVGNHFKNANIDFENLGEKAATSNHDSTNRAAVIHAELTKKDIKNIKDEIRNLAKEKGLSISEEEIDNMILNTDKSKQNIPFISNVLDKTEYKDGKYDKESDAYSNQNLNETYKNVRYEENDSKEKETNMVTNDKEILKNLNIERESNWKDKLKINPEKLNENKESLDEEAKLKNKGIDSFKQKVMTDTDELLETSNLSYNKVTIDGTTVYTVDINDEKELNKLKEIQFETNIGASDLINEDGKTKVILTNAQNKDEFEKVYSTNKDKFKYSNEYTAYTYINEDIKKAKVLAKNSENINSGPLIKVSGESIENQLARIGKETEGLNYNNNNKQYIANNNMKDDIANKQNYENNINSVSMMNHGRPIYRYTNIAKVNLDSPLSKEEIAMNINKNKIDENAKEIKKLSKQNKVAYKTNNHKTIRDNTNKMYELAQQNSKLTRKNAEIQRDINKTKIKTGTNYDMTII